jgi:hypothetical protein
MWHIQHFQETRLEQAADHPVILNPKHKNAKKRATDPSEPPHLVPARR